MSWLQKLAEGHTLKIASIIVPEGGSFRAAFALATFERQAEFASEVRAWAPRGGILLDGDGVELHRYHNLQAMDSEDFPPTEWICDNSTGIVIVSDHIWPARANVSVFAVKPSGRGSSSQSDMIRKLQSFADEPSAGVRDDFYRIEVLRGQAPPVDRKSPVAWAESNALWIPALLRCWNR